MAKKKNDSLTYMQLPLPQGQKAYKLTKVNWSGLNKRQTMDTGVLSMENNISTDETPYLIPSQKRLVYKSGYTNPISIFGFDNFLLVVYRSGTQIKIDYIKSNGTTYTGTLKSSGATSADEYQRCIVKFNVYDTPTDPVSGEFVKKLLIFPDKKSMDFEISSNFTPADMDVGINQIPDLKYATVHLSRLFGVDDDRVYASGFNDYTNWNLDTVDEYNVNNAWVSPAQANTKANSSFTGITTFMNHVICFKENFMHEIYNNKNPFRLQDIFAEGCIDNRSIQDVDGRLIFTDRDNVKVYTGANPRIIGYNLNVGEFLSAVSGTDNRKYYLYCETDKNTHNLFVYDTLIDQWAEESIDFEVLGFAHNQNGMYLLGKDGNVYRLDSGNYNQSWRLETDFFTGKTIDIKHIKKIQLLAQIPSGSDLDIYVLYDDEQWSLNSHRVYSGSGGGQVPIRIVPRQTASYGFKLHIRGYGYVKLYGLEVFVTNGGDLYV
jgi:hypothetical protein